MFRRKKPKTNISSYVVNKNKIPRIVKAQAKERKSVIYGARAMNVQMAGVLHRKTRDWDVYSKKPKTSANLLQRKLDKQVASGFDDFYMKPAEHKGTFKVMHEGWDGKKKTKDDFGIADYTKMPKKLPTVKVGGVRYESLRSIKKDKKKILKDPESKYRHKKDKSDLQSMRTWRKFRGKGIW